MGFGSQIPPGDPKQALLRASAPPAADASRVAGAFQPPQVLPQPTPPVDPGMWLAMFVQSTLPGQMLGAFNRGARHQIPGIEEARTRPLNPSQQALSLIAGLAEPDYTDLLKLAGLAGMVGTTKSAREFFPQAMSKLDELKLKGNQVRLDDLKALGFDTDNVYYHGTSKDYPGLPDPNMANEWNLYGKGSYFTNNPEVAAGYSGMNPGNMYGSANIKPVFLSVRNPLDIEAPANLDDWYRAVKDKNIVREWGTVTRETLSKQSFEEIVNNTRLPLIDNSPPTNGDVFQAIRSYEEAHRGFGGASLEAATSIEEEMKDLVEYMGYDGITHTGGGRYNPKDPTRHKVMIAFHPEQIAGAFEESPDVINRILPTIPEKR